MKEEERRRIRKEKWWGAFVCYEKCSIADEMIKIGWRKCCQI